MTPTSILLAFDDGYARHGAACMASILRHTPGPIEFVVASCSDPAPFADKLRRSFARNPRVTLDIRHLPLPPDMQFPLPGKLTRETYARFWIGDLFPDRSRALYIDPDTIATTSLAPLWATDLEGHVLAAVPIPGSTRPREHRMPPGSAFFNAGVLLIDLDAWRTRSYRDKCLAYLRANPECALDGDQDVLNLCTQHDWLPLPLEWNVISPFYRLSHDLGLPLATIRAVRDNARIVHFNGANKPWSYLDDHPRKADYLANLAETAWHDWRPPDRTLINILRKHTAPLAPAWLRRRMRRVLAVP